MSTQTEYSNLALEDFKPADKLLKLNPFSTIVPLLYPLSGGIEVEQWFKMG